MAKQKNTTPVVEQNKTTTETTKVVENVNAPEATTETTKLVENANAPETTTETTKVVENSNAPEATTQTTKEVEAANAQGKTTEDVAKPDVVDFSAEAEELMRAQYIKEIWRCPVKGYWFTKFDLASEHGKKVDKKPEHYTL